MPFPASASLSLRPTLRGALIAGLAAGLVSTLAQLALWAFFTDWLPDVLWRDTRLAAAIVLGPAVLGGHDSARAMLAPAALPIVLAAGAVHGAISVAFGALFHVAACRTCRSEAGAALLGIKLGSVMFAVNLYGFTAIWPWFDVARDWITFAAHQVFGLSATLAGRLAERAPKTPP